MFWYLQTFTSSVLKLIKWDTDLYVEATPNNPCVLIGKVYEFG